VRALNSTLLAYAFLNRADPRGQDNEEAAAVIRDTQALTFLDAPLGNRKAFANAGAIGLGVSELLPNDQKAVAEITTLFARLFNVAPTLKRRAGLDAGHAQAEA
jgi:chromosome partitioning protein